MAEAATSSTPRDSTFVYRLDEKPAFQVDEPSLQKHPPMPKRPAGQDWTHVQSRTRAHEGQEERLKKIPVNQWVALADPVRIAPVRTLGLGDVRQRSRPHPLWGGGHCGYGGSDVDSYDVANHTWIGSEEHPEYPHRLSGPRRPVGGRHFRGQSVDRAWTTHLRLRSAQS